MSKPFVKPERAIEPYLARTETAPLIIEQRPPTAKIGRPKELDSSRPPNRARRARFHAFLSLYKSTGSFGASCTALNVSPRSIQRWIETWPEFKEQYEDAQMQVLGVLEEELLQRAVVGWNEPVASMGEVVAYVRKKSDKLLELALRANAPKKYAPFNQRTIGAEMGVDKEGNKYFKVYEGFDPKDV